MYDYMGLRINIKRDVTFQWLTKIHNLFYNYHGLNFLLKIIIAEQMPYKQ